MFLELIGTVFAGIAAAGVVLIVNKMSGGRLPNWLTPVGAGLAMLATTISNEYSWYGRTTATLPEGLVVALPIEKSSFYQPWTRVAPYVDRFVAVDETSLKRNPALPEQRMIDLYFFGRWAPLKKVPVVYDCAGARRATLIDGVVFSDTGEILDADWMTIDRNDPVMNAVCQVA